jgi:oxygen-independent coproporphyrinogen-3 oxidase
MPPGLYIHIPFCRAKCAYCSFTSIATPPPAAVDRYIDALRRDIAAVAPTIPSPAGTVYVGGGTPTILEERQLTLLFDAVRESLRLLPDAEISIEANPGTVTAAKARHLRRLNVNRVSLGVQSFSDAALRRLGRLHSSADARSALSLLREAGIANVGLDLIYGTPGQARKNWEDDLEEAVATRPQHLSLYALSVEDGTPFALTRRSGQLDLPAEEDVIWMYRHAGERLAAAGYEHYEISNWSLPGFRSRHNENCWLMEEYAAAGAGAHAFRLTPSPRRTANTGDIDEYIRTQEAGVSPVASETLLSSGDLAAETLMLGLRLRDGISLASFLRRCGATPEALFPEGMRMGFENGWIHLEEGRIRLTDSGILFSDELFQHFF